MRARQTSRRFIKVLPQYVGRYWLLLAWLKSGLGQRRVLLLLMKQGFSLYSCPVTELDETVSVILILFQVSFSKRKVLVYVDS